METVDCADERGRAGDRQGGVSALERVRVTIRGLYSKVVRSFRSVIKYIRARLSKKDDEVV